MKNLSDFLSNRKQRVFLIGQYSTLANVKARVPQGSFLEPLLFLKNNNGLSNSLLSKLFANDTSLFSAVTNHTQSGVDFNTDLRKISQWVFQFKMNWNLALTKQSQELLFFNKSQNTNSSLLFFKQNPTSQATFQKHLQSFKKYLRQTLVK